MSDKSEIFYPPVGTGTIELKLSSADADGQLSMFLQTLPPGEGTNEHMHRDCDETGHVLEGTLTAKVGGEMVTYSPGDTFFIKRGIPHAISNFGDETLKFLFTVTPGGIEGYFREVSDKDMNAPDDIARLAKIADKYGLAVIGPPISG